jgi:hypothetical protein
MESQTQWYLPVIPAIQEAEAVRSQDQSQTGELNKNPMLKYFLEKGWGSS